MLTGMGNACFLNLLIAPTQLIAAFIGIFDGLSTMGSSYKRYSVLSSGRRRCRAVALQRGLEADYFVVEDLVASEASKSYHEWITALWDVVCGVCFLFLTANSLCIISLKPVIDALTVMEVALIYFLYLMWTAYTSARTQQTATESLAAVGIVPTFLSMLIWVLGQTRSAISSIVSQYLGADKLDDVKNLPAQAIFLITSLSLLIIIFTFPFL